MRALFSVLLALAVALTIAYLMVLGRPSRHPDRGVAWWLAATGWAGLAVDLALLVALLGTRVPAWLFATVLLVQDTVFGWRLYLVAKARP